MKRRSPIALENRQDSRAQLTPSQAIQGFGIGSEIRNDDDVFGMYLRDLEYREAEVQRTQYPELLFAAGKIIPLEIKNMPHVRYTTYHKITAMGRFKLRRSYTTTAPNVNLVSEEITQKIESYDGGYYLTEDDLEAAEAIGSFPIEQEMIASVREVAFQKMNDLIAFGDALTNTPGILNHPEMMRTWSPYKISALSTPSQILALLNESVNAVPIETLGVEIADTMIMPRTQHYYISNARLDNVATPTTIMQQFKATNSHIVEVAICDQCTGAGPNGEDVMLILRRDPRKGKAMITSDFRFKPFIRQGNGLQRPADFKYGGIRLYRPMSFHLVIGI
jgi:hypothetical protein